jgi:predicted enzyme related to lactoylglutathione lyase
VTRSFKGQFVWHELLTSDPDAAKGFYTGVVDWSSQAWGPDGYSLWMSGEMPVGGFMAMPPEVKQTGAPPHWLSYIGTPNVDDTCAHATRLGGRILKEPFDVPTVGRIAVLADPQGAVFCVYKPESDEYGHDGPPRVGEFSWHELATTDPNGAFAFYGSLFGWNKVTEFDMGPAGVYQLFGLGEVPMGGIYAKPAEVPVSNWLPYALVKSADGAASKVQSLGGTIMVGPMEVPGGDRIAVGMDPQGAVFAVHSRAAQA